MRFLKFRFEYYWNWSVSFFSVYRMWGCMLVYKLCLYDGSLNIICSMLHEVCLLFLLLLTLIDLLGWTSLIIHWKLQQTWAADDNFEGYNSQLILFQLFKKQSGFETFSIKMGQFVIFNVYSLSFLLVRLPSNNTSTF